MAKPQTVNISEDGVRMVVKSDDASVIEVSGPLDQAIAQLKKRIGEIGKKADPTEQDQKQRKALEKAIQELAKLTGQMKDELRLSQPGERKVEKRVMVLRSVDDSTKKPLNDEQKAEAKKLHVAVQKLKSELEAKAKELAEAQARLAKLEGTHSAATVLLHRIDGQGRAQVVRDLGGGRFAVDTREVDLRSPKTVHFTRVDPTKPHTEATTVEKRPMTVEVRRVYTTKPHIETTYTTKPYVEARKVYTTKPHIETTYSTKPHIETTVVVDDQLERIEKLAKSLKKPEDEAGRQQRIEELEKTLKKLVEEVARLKNDR